MEYKITEIIQKNQKYLFYGVCIFYLVLSTFMVSMFAVGYDNYKDGIIWVLIGAGLFGFWKMTEYEQDRYLYLTLTIGCLFIYFTLDLLLITILALIFFVLYWFELFKDCKIWFKENKITL